MFIKIFRGFENKYLLLETKSAVLNKESITLPWDIVPLFFRMIDELSLPVDEGDYKRMDKLQEMANEKAKEHNISFSFDEAFRVLIPDRTFCSAELILTADEISDKNGVFQKLESSEPKDRCSHYKISSITVDNKTYFTTGSIFIMNDDGKTIDRV